MSSTRFNLYFGLGLTVVLAVMVLKAPLAESLWMDECISSWVTSQDLAQTISRTVDFQAQSPLYFVFLWISRQWFGSSEVQLRIPSLVFAFFGGLLLFGGVKKLWGTKFGLLAVVALVSQDSFLRSAVAARPYALGFAGLGLGMFSLAQWWESHPWRAWFWYVLGSLVVIYAHYLFAPALLVPVALIACRQRSWHVFWPGFLAWAVIGLCSVPALVHLKLIALQAGVYSYSKTPDFVDLLKAIIPPVFAVYFLCAASLAALFGEGKFRSWIPSPSVFVMLGVGALGPIVIALACWFGGSSLWVERHFSWSACALSLALVIWLQGLPEKTTCIFMVAFLGLILMREVQRRWYFEDWRGRLAEASTSGEQLLIYSGLVEWESREWREDPTRRSYLVESLAHYYRPPAGARFVWAEIETEQLESRLQAAPRVQLVVANSKVYRKGELPIRVIDRLRELFEKLGYELRDKTAPGWPVRWLEAQKK